ncbi:hypothetical protein [Methylosinus sp. Ce-a6]|uniref:hypothetical protein n=1 Tax=Methylosinus sp. Ce-a6 TaxID=2172005 RepID=UPI00135C5EAB|nr:hypothetical protein [Methylosinus sp. Ce-a6]
MLREVSLVLIACFATGFAAAEPRSIGDCERIQAADAYNRCLASFGPAAHARNARSSLSFAPAEPIVSHGGERAGPFAERGRRGRPRMTFTPGSR